MTFQLTNLTSAQETHPKAVPFEFVEPKKPSAYRSFGKRALDVTLVVATAWITIPIIAILALVVLVTGQTPFYVQDRVGQGGRTFRMWKVRTMLPDAERRLEEYLASNPDARAEWDSKQKLLDDPRVTPIGNWLRKTSLDELPQLLNVFNGTMSLVGPRPMMLDQKVQYTGNAYYRLRPGITGTWQISDRNACEFIGRVRFDEDYDRNLAFATDFKILLRTVSVVIRGTGC